MRARRRASWRVAAFAALAVAFAGLAGAQEPPAPADVPAGEATLRGHVVHTARTDGGVADVEVVLYALAGGDAPGVRRTTTDAQGRFEFAGISASADVTYLVGARYATIPFPGDRVVFGAGETERWVEVRVSEPTADASRVRVLQSSLRVEWLGDRIGIGEVHQLRNEGDAVYHVAPDARAGRTPPLHAELPDGAQAFAMPLGVVPEGVDQQGRDFRFWGPLYPGEQEITFRYEIPVASGLTGVAKRFPSGAERLRIFGQEGGPLEGGDGLETRAVVDESGMRFQPFEREPLAAGFATVLRLRIPETTADGGAVELVESQMVIEVDDVILSAQEQLQLEVPGTAVARSVDGAPLLQLALPAGAENVRFSGDAQGLGLVRTDEGLGLLGPLAPGSHALGLAYDLRADAGRVAFSRAYDRPLPLLRVFVADTGVAVETDRLHRRRPVRDADRTFLVYEGFEIEGGEPLGFSLQALPPRVSSGTPALVLALLAGVGAAWFLVAPLAERDETLPEAEEDAGGWTARREREAVYESIRDLDHDHETGKLLDADWERLRAELRARAVALLAEERRHEPSAPAPAAEAARICHACGATVGEADRFCARCGAGLDAEPRSA